MRIRLNRKQVIPTIGIICLFTITCGKIIFPVAFHQKIILKEVGQIDTNGEAYDVQVIGDLAYVVDTTDDNPGGLVIIDISDLSNPKKLSSYFIDGLPNSLFVTTETAYLTAKEEGLQIINVSDPTNPKKIGSHNDGGYATHVQVLGDIAFLADNADGLEVLNVSDPAHPNELCQYKPIGRYFHDFFIKDNLMYITDHCTQYTGIRVLNISNPCNIFELGNYIRYEIDFIYPFVYNNYLFAADHHDESGELRILDVHDPTNITQVSEFHDGGFTMETFVEGDLAYVTNFHEGLEVLDISDPSNPAKIGQYHDGSGHATDVFVSDNIAFMTDRDDVLEIIEISFEDDIKTSNSSPGFEMYFVIFVLTGFILDIKIRSKLRPRFK
ncbi:MAG: LVIVD repeat-containing protein [Promethearchaeota archaeon]